MLGSSTGQDEEGNVYGCYDYFSTNRKCILGISVGVKDNKLLGQVMGCGDYLKLEVTPTLR